MNYKIITPTVTILDEDYNIDTEGNKKVINYLLEGGVDGFAPLGSTGEFLGLSMDSKKELIKLYADEVDGKAEIIAGTSSMYYDEIIELSEYAIEVGCDAVMILPPYYYALDQDEAFEWYSKLAEDIDGDIYIYNFEARTGFNIGAETVAKLAEKYDNIVGIKDSTLNVANTKAILKAVLPVDEDFIVYSGFDNQFVENILSGGNGNISALSNFAPEVWADWIKAAKEGNFEKIKEIHTIIEGLMETYDAQSNFSYIFKRFMEDDGLDISTVSVFPHNRIDDELFDKFNNARKEILESRG